MCGQPSPSEASRPSKREGSAPGGDKDSCARQARAGAPVLPAAGRFPRNAAPAQARNLTLSQFSVGTPQNLTRFVSFRREETIIE